MTNRYIYSIVLYRSKDNPDFDIAIGVIAGSDRTEEWSYYTFREGVALIEEQGISVDMKLFWENGIIDFIHTEAGLIDKYLELAKSDSEFVLLEPFTAESVSSQKIVRQAEDGMRDVSYVLPNGQARFEFLLRN